MCERRCEARGRGRLCRHLLEKEPSWPHSLSPRRPDKAYCICLSLSLSPRPFLLHLFPLPLCRCSLYLNFAPFVFFFHTHTHTLTRQTHPISDVCASLSPVHFLSFLSLTPTLSPPLSLSLSLPFIYFLSPSVSFLFRGVFCSQDDD